MNRVVTAAGAVKDSLEMDIRVNQLKKIQPPNKHHLRPRQIFRHLLQSIGYVISVPKMLIVTRASVNVAKDGKVMDSAVCPSALKDMCGIPNNAYRKQRVMNVSLV